MAHCAPLSTWHQGLQILSLELIDPLYQELGVEVEPRGVLRELVRDALAAWVASGPSISTDPSVDVEAFRAEVRRSFGTADAHHIEDWVAYTVCGENENPWVLYEEAISNWASAYIRTHRDDIGFSANPKRIASELRLLTDTSAIAATLQELRKRPLTSWDESVLTKLGLVDIPAESDFFPLADAIELTIARQKFRVFWTWLLSFLSALDINLVGDYVNSRAGKEGVAFVPPQDLPRR